MGFFDSLFSKKPTKRDIAAFNYFLLFTYIPKQLKWWSEGKAPIQSALSLPSSVIEKHPEWKSLNKKITVTTSTLKKCEDVTMYLIKAPSTEMMGEVLCAMFGVNPNLKKYEYFTMEFSLGNFAICTADENSNHYFMDNCSDAEQFGAYVIKQSMESLIPKPKPAAKPILKPAMKNSRSNPPIQEQPKTQNTPVYPSALADTYYTLDQLRQIPMGGLRLQPIDAGIVFDRQQQEIISLFTQKSPRIKRFLPNLDLSSPEAVQKYFTTFCQKTEMQLEFGYSIKMNKHGDLGYMGFIFVHTPMLNEVAINFPQWTIDFCMFEPLEGKRFMRTPLRHVLLMLKNDLGVKNIFAIVDEDNIQCLNFMKSLPFQLQPEVLTDPTTGKKAKLFMCPLSHIEITFKSQS